MKVTTKDTKTKSKRGGSRPGSGRKSSGIEKKRYTYFLPTEIGEAISKQDNPSEFVEAALKHALRPTIPVINNLVEISEEEFRQMGVGQTIEETERLQRTPKHLR